ncbi:MAG: LysR family transcriptional regulator, partial [Pseudomonadota bacterium]|nr:LysR family transcriptional regulator [Pseudomonadota bacterium]
GLQWLRGLVVRFIRERVQRHEMLLSQCCRKAYCAETVKRFMDQRNMDCEEFTPAHLKTPSNDEMDERRDTVVVGKETA